MNYSEEYPDPYEIEPEEAGRRFQELSEKRKRGETLTAIEREYGVEILHSLRRRAAPIPKERKAPSKVLTLDDLTSDLKSL